MNWNRTSITKENSASGRIKDNLGSGIIEVILLACRGCYDFDRYLSFSGRFVVGHYLDRIWHLCCKAEAIQKIQPGIDPVYGSVALYIFLFRNHFRADRGDAEEGFLRKKVYAS